MFQPLKGNGIHPDAAQTQAQTCTPGFNPSKETAFTLTMVEEVVETKMAGFNPSKETAFTLTAVIHSGMRHTLL
jgi:hypothetical protein